MAQDSATSAVVSTNSVYPIDLPTVLRLANAQNLDVKIARERLTEAKANHDSAVEQFFPWISPGAAYRRHDGEIQAVDGSMFGASKQSYTAGGTLTAQMDLGDAIYKSLAAKQLVKAADHALESQRQDSTFAAAQGYYDLAKAKAPIATETLERIAALYKIEERVRGKGAADRLAVREPEQRAHPAGREPALEGAAAGERRSVLVGIRSRVEGDEVHPDVQPAGEVSQRIRFAVGVVRARDQRPLQQHGSGRAGDRGA